MDLRYSDTNAGTDSTGRVFGLDGNLYLPLVMVGLLGIGLAGSLILIWQVRWQVAAVLIAVICAMVLVWVLALKRGRPAGFDRDWLEHLGGQGHFTRLDQKEVK